MKNRQPTLASAAALLTACLLGAPVSRAQETVVATPTGQESITAEELHEHVATLADDRMEGRAAGTVGHQLAEDYLVAAFKELGLEPAGLNGTYLQELQSSGGRRRRRPRKEDAEKAPKKPVIAGKNILGMLKGSDEQLAEEVIIISAHYDHLGVVDGKIHNGADDNASGVAALLELAEAFAGLEGDARPKRSILFASWDLEEVGLIGSTYWVKNPTVELEKVAFMMSMDMLSRDFMGVLKEEMMVLGTEDSDQVAAVVKGVEAPEEVSVVVIGSDLVGSRSDHYPFMVARIPYLFFTTGTSKFYHTAEDDVETIDSEKLHRNTCYIYDVIAASAAGERPVFNESPRRSVDEFKHVLRVLDKIQEKQDSFVEVPGLFETLAGIRAQVATVIESGEIDEAQRNQLKMAAGMLVFQLQEK